MHVFAYIAAILAAAPLARADAWIWMMLHPPAFAPAAPAMAANQVSMLSTCTSTETQTFSTKTVISNMTCLDYSLPSLPGRSANLFLYLGSGVAYCDLWRPPGCPGGAVRRTTGPVERIIGGPVGYSYSVKCTLKTK